MTYRGRIAPSPTGLLHVGHARTFWTAQERTRAANGILVLRNEDLDSARFKGEFVTAMLEDMKWFGLEWQEGPYTQSERRSFYQATFEKLRAGGWIYPCTCSRQDVLRALQAPHAEGEEPVYPGTCRKNTRVEGRINWRFRVPDGETISFTDGNLGPQQFVTGKDFGDFVIWRHDDVPSYQLAVVTDDAAMQITEVVRGADLLVSTARQLLLYRALNLEPPAFYHCPLVMDDSGVRLAKRHDSLSLRSLREKGVTPEKIRSEFKIA